MAKKRDRQGRGTERRAETEARAPDRQGTSFAGDDLYPNQGVELEGWGDDQKTAPDIFADPSDEDQMRAGDGHPHQLDEEARRRQEKDGPTLRRR
jgi:hypothetical protein